MDLPDEISASLSNPLKGFIKELEAKNRSQFTITAYKKDLEQLASYLMSQKIQLWEQTDTAILSKYINFLKQEKDYTLKTISRKINSLKTFYKYLISRNIVSKNFAEKISHPKIEKQVPRVLSQLEYKALRDTARDNLRLYTIIEMLLQTGMRIGELSRLKRKDVDIAECTIKIQPFSSYPKREIEINSVLENALGNYIKNYSADVKSEYFFYSKNGNKLLIRNIRSSIDMAFKKTGIKDVTVNDLRNTFIFHQLEQGIQLELLAKTVGHKRVATTENYLEFVESRPRKSIKKLTPL